MPDRDSYSQTKAKRMSGRLRIIALLIDNYHQKVVSENTHPLTHTRQKYLATPQRVTGRARTPVH